MGTIHRDNQAINHQTIPNHHTTTSTSATTMSDSVKKMNAEMHSKDNTGVQDENRSMMDKVTDAADAAAVKMGIKNPKGGDMTDHAEKARDKAMNMDGSSGYRGGDAPGRAKEMQGDDMTDKAHVAMDQHVVNAGNAGFHNK